MSEKLSAFAALYAEKAAADVENQKANVVKSEEKLKRATELWNTLKAESEKLGIVDKFTSVFPEAGGDVILTIGGVSANPNFTNLMSYGEPLESSVRELTKLKRTKRKLENSRNELAYTEELAARKPEDHINILGQEILKIAADAASGGGNTIESLFKSFFSTYESFKEIMNYEVTNTPGPTSVNSSKEAYEVLKDKLQSSNIKTTQNNEGSGASPINEPSAESTEAVSPTKSGINATEGVQTGTTEKTTGETSIVTEGKPEVAKTEGAPVAATTINLNLEKKEEPSQPSLIAAEAPATIGPINEPSVTPSPQASVETPAPSVTQQNINLSESNQTSVSSPTTSATQTVSGDINTQTTSNASTINQSSLESREGGPKFLDKVKATAGKALSPIGERLASEGKDLLGVAGSQLERMGVPINLLGKAAERIRERKKEKSVIGTTSSAINMANTNTTQSTTNVAGSDVSTTSNTSLTQSNVSSPIEANVEKLNPSVAGNPTTAQPEPKVDLAVNQPVSPTQPQQSTPTVTEAKPQKPISLTPPNQPVADQAPTIMDVSSLEKRLKRIEQALSNPLEVIIKES